MRIQANNTVTNIIFGQDEITKNIFSTLKDMSPASDAFSVSISDEARIKYRNYANNLDGSGNQSNIDSNFYKEILSKSIVDITGLTQSKFHMQFMQQNTQKIKNKNEVDDIITELSKNCFEVYTTMYNEIKSGYANGTREIWTVDSTVEKGFRKVTADEEIDALDCAYNFYAKVIDAYAKDAMTQLKADLQNQGYKKIKEEYAEEGMADIHNRLLKATQLWKDNFSINRNNLSVLFKQIINNMFLPGLNL